MDVTFTRMDKRHYGVAICREHGPDVPVRTAPGYDDWMPHDLAQYVVEEQFGIKLGIFGQTAAGGGPFTRDRRTTRTTQRLNSVAEGDVSRSVRLVAICEALWRRQAFGTELPEWVADEDVADPEVQACAARLAEVSRRWHRLEPGRSLSFSWPTELTLDPAGSRAGRRTMRSATGRRGRGH